jgi:hypothetical protein
LLIVKLLFRIEAIRACHGERVSYVDQMLKGKRTAVRASYWR